MSKKKILVIEDNAVNMELVCDLLEMAGYDIIQAADAESGIKVADKEQPDLILMDISLPGMDGLQATRVLKQRQSARQIPVVALTAHAMKGDEDKVLEAGCNGYITKPINTREFSRQIEKFLGSSTGG